MKFSAKLNGLPCVIEIPDDALASLKAITEPKDLNQKQAAQFCRVSVPTFRKWNVTPNENGRYSVERLKARMESDSFIKKRKRAMAKGSRGKPKR